MIFYLNRNHITSHPALHQKHLFVGQEPPNFDPDRMRSGRERSLDGIHKRTNGGSVAPDTEPSQSLSSSETLALAAPSGQPTNLETDGQDKVSKSQFPSEEICTTDRQWEQINETHDFYDNKVLIVQEEGLQQFVFTYRCANVKGMNAVGIPSTQLSLTILFLNLHRSLYWHL